MVPSLLYTQGIILFSHPIVARAYAELSDQDISEEIYVISHHVHHVKTDEPYDPYNSKAGINVLFVI